MIEIDDYWELLALHKAIMAAKFNTDGTSEFLTSPFLAEAARKVLSALITAEVKRSGVEKKAAWEEWKKIDINRNEWKILIATIMGNTRYKTLNDDDFKREVSDIISPLEITDEQIRSLVSTCK